MYPSMDRPARTSPVGASAFEYLTSKFQLAFGAPFNVDEHDPESDDVRPLWWEAVRPRGSSMNYRMEE